MGRIEYKRGDLFQAGGPKSILVHACNCMGVWGSGIAVEFRNRYPHAYEDYKDVCRKKQMAGQLETHLLGTGFWTGYPIGAQRVGCLFTSLNYGKLKDSPGKILKQTRLAVDMLLCITPPEYTVHSPKINSGLFAVPWGKTEAVLEEALTKYPHHNWTVWDNS